MLFSRKTIVVALALMGSLAVPSMASAQVESTPVPMQPKPDFSSMSFLLGTWTCSTKSARRPSAFTSTSTYTADPDGYWLDERTVVNPMAWANFKRTIYDKITYDGRAHRWADVTWGAMGGYGLAVSSGWTGNSITWHDLSFIGDSDITSQSDVTTTREGNTLVSRSNFTEAKGRVVDVVERCTKS